MDDQPDEVTPRKRKKRRRPPELPAWTPYYRAFAYFGMLSVTSSLLFGFRYRSDAAWGNVLVNLLFYGLYMVPHLVMTRSWYKLRFWGREEGGPSERRAYITVAILGWLLLLIVHRPLPGWYLQLPSWLQFMATVGFLFFFLRAFEGVDFSKMDGMLGVPGSSGMFSHGPETPLFTEGSYAQVRHPMYQAMLGAGFCALLLHPSIAQLFWTLLIGGTFVAFIPVEEAQLRAARREEYEEYVERTPWRLVPGVW